MHRSLVACLIVLLFAQVASAYSLRKNTSGVVLIWDADAVEIQIDGSGIPGVPGVADAVRAGFLVWTSAGVPVSVSFETRKGKINGRDKKNVMRWETVDWPYAKEVVAMTVTMYSAKTGFVSDSDVIFNAVDDRWTTAAQSGGTRFDVGSVMAHEAGHFFGLNHSTALDSTMFATTPPGETKKRSLAQDDLDGIVALVGEINRRRGKVITPPPPTKTDAGAPNADPGSPPAVVSEPLPAPGGIPLARSNGCSLGGDLEGLSLFGLLLPLVGLWALARRRLGELLALSILFCATPAQATTIKAVSLDQLAQRAQVVVEGEIVAQQARFDGPMIFTEHRVRVTACHRGSCGKVIVLRTLGGRVGDVGLHVEGMLRLHLRQKLMVFARMKKGALQAVGLNQGIFFVDAGGRATRDLRGVHLLERDARGVKFLKGDLQHYSVASLAEVVRRFTPKAAVKTAR